MIRWGSSVIHQPSAAAVAQKFSSCQRNPTTGAGYDDRRLLCQSRLPNPIPSRLSSILKNVFPLKKPTQRTLLGGVLNVLIIHINVPSSF